VRRESAASLPEALDALQAAVLTAERGPGRAAVDIRTRRFTPEQLVASRVELKGPGGVRAGVDVRGDGSSVAWRGRVSKRVVEPEAGESPLAALRRELEAS
jgi:hypothetical protein